MSRKHQVEARSLSPIRHMTNSRLSNIEKISKVIAKRTQPGTRSKCPALIAFAIFLFSFFDWFVLLIGLLTCAPGISERNRTQTNQSPRGAMCSTLFLSKGVGFSGENPKNSISPEKLLRRRGLGFRLLILSFLLLFYIISLFCKVSHRGRGQRNTRVRALLQAFFSKQQYNVCRQNSKN